MNDCQGVFGSLFGHKFKVIFDEEAKFIGTNDEITTIMEANLFNEDNKIHALKELNDITTTYIHSICTRCGQVIKKE
jgi:hypothetical protein